MTKLAQIRKHFQKNLRNQNEDVINQLRLPSSGSSTSFNFMPCQKVGKMRTITFSSKTFANKFLVALRKSKFVSSIKNVWSLYLERVNV